MLLLMTNILFSIGIAALIVMLLMYTTSIESIRRPNFELFWYTHHLFVLYFILGSIHGLNQWFGAPGFWYWVIGPLVLYMVERTVRFLRGKQTTMLLLVCCRINAVVRAWSVRLSMSMSMSVSVRLCVSVSASMSVKSERTLRANANLRPLRPNNIRHA
jgi:hypothetical protein